MSPAALQQSFEIKGFGSLRVGTTKKAQVLGSNGPTMLPGKAWAISAGAYTPRQMVEANAPLLEVVLHHLGPNPSDGPSTREMLLDNLASNLALNTRESSISIPARDPARIEMADQATKIGQKLIEYAFGATGVQYDPNYIVRSPCEGHLLKPHVAYLMFGPRSLRHLMQIYNEYLHQMVLLRDALLPFENFEEVIIPINDDPERKRGMRHTEDARMPFLSEMTVRQSKQSSLVKFAQSTLAPKLPFDNTCAFQYKYGCVLPSFLVGGHSPRLLRFVSATLDLNQEEIAFRNELVDYYEAPRAELGDEAEASANTTPESLSQQTITSPVAYLVSVESEEGKVRHLSLVLSKDDGSHAEIDVGQIARGRRFAYVVSDEAQDSTMGIAVISPKVYSAWDILSKSGDGLIMPSKGIHVIKTGSIPELFGVLGKLYPDNIVIKNQAHTLNQALGAGKEGFLDAGRFIVEAPSEADNVFAEWFVQND